MCSHLVGRLGFGANEYDWDVPRFFAALEVLSHAPAVQLREHDVQHDEVGPLRASHLERLAAGSGLQRLEAGGAEIYATDQSNRGLVIDDEDAASIDAIGVAGRRGGAEPFTSRAEWRCGSLSAAAMRPVRAVTPTLARTRPTANRDVECARQGAGDYSLSPAGGALSAKAANQLLEYVSTGAFTALALVSLRYWLGRRDRPSLWAALCFGSLAAVSLAGFVTPENPETGAEKLEVQLLIVVLLLFPYLLFRFAASFTPASRLTELLAGILTIGLVAWTFALPEIPSDDEPRSRAFTLYLVALMLDWALLSFLMAARLWRAGRGQPSVPRRRMRLLSFAATVLTLALLLAVANAESNQMLELGTSLLGIASAALFALGLSPPTFVRLYWRRPELDRVRDATGRLIAANTPDEVTSDVLPPLAKLVGADAIFLLDREGKVLASHGAPPEAIDTNDAALRVETAGGTLVVWTGPYAPFFGEEELDLMRSVGSLIGLALDRSRLFVREHEARLELERADALKSNFIALAAHELRTPVTSVHGIISTLDRIGDQLSQPDVEELREALRTQSDRMRRLVEQLLDLSRLDAETVPIHPVPIPVRAEVEGLVTAAAGDQARDVEIAVPADLQARIDRAVFERVFSNLLTNALRHGAAPVRVTAEQRDRHFRLTVEDRGPGVPVQFVDELFERFSRSDEARARGLGSGLGLSIARSYAQAHGGDLVYEPAKPRGARFQLVIPQEGATPGQANLT